MEKNFVMEMEKRLAADAMAIVEIALKWHSRNTTGNNMALRMAERMLEAMEQTEYLSMRADAPRGICRDEPAPVEWPIALNDLVNRQE